MVFYVDKMKSLIYVSNEENQIEVYYHFSFKKNSSLFDLDINDENFDDHKEDMTSVGYVSIDDGELAYIEVDGDWQGKGVGSKLIELAKLDLDLHIIDCAQETKDTNYSLTIPGQNLIASCIRKGIVDAKMCNFPDDNDGASSLGISGSGIVRVALERGVVKKKNNQKKITDFFSKKKKKKAKKKVQPKIDDDVKMTDKFGSNSF